MLSGRGANCMRFGLLSAGYSMNPKRGSALPLLMSICLSLPLRRLMTKWSVGMATNDTLREDGSGQAPQEEQKGAK